MVTDQLGWVKRYEQMVDGGGIESSTEREEQLVTAVLGLAGEAGEVADLLKKSRHQGGMLGSLDMLEELGDVLWYVTRVAKLLDWDLYSLAYDNIVKLHQRHPHKYKELL